MTFTHALSTNNYGTAKFIVSSSAAEGTHTTIASALTAASSGDTIFIRPGTYTENITLKAGVNLTAFECDSSFNGTGLVTISGTCTSTSAGTVTISAIQLQTNSADILAVTGSANSVVNLNNCYLNMTNNSGITFSTSGASSQIQLSNCRGNLGTTGIAIFAHSSAGNLSFTNTIITNSGGSSTANTCSSGALTLLDGAFLSNPVTLSSTGRITAKFSEIDSSATNSTSLTTVSGTTNDLEYVRLSSGTATPLSVGGTVSANGLSLHHTNATGITGAGTLLYSGAGIWQDSTVGAISVTTLIPKFVLGALNSTTPPAGYIGEQIRSYNSSPQNLTTATPLNVTSIAITAGIWDVSGMVQFGGGAITGTSCAWGIGPNSASFTGTSGGDNQGNTPTVPTANSTLTVSIPSFRVALSTTTTYYLLAQSTFTVGTVTALGRISATRVA